MVMSVKEASYLVVSALLFQISGEAKPRLATPSLPSGPAALTRAHMPCHSGADRLVPPTAVSLPPLKTPQPEMRSPDCAATSATARPAAASGWSACQSGVSKKYDGPPPPCVQ